MTVRQMDAFIVVGLVTQARITKVVFFVYAKTKKTIFMILAERLILKNEIKFRN